MTFHSPNTDNLPRHPLIIGDRLAESGSGDVHAYSAMANGDATQDEMFEFALQYAIHGGWPKGSVMQVAVMTQGERVAKSLPFQP